MNYINQLIFCASACALVVPVSHLNSMERVTNYLHGTNASQAEIANAQTCPICMANLADGNALRTLRCNPNGVPHIFHRTCINAWLLSRQNTNQRANCPLCQTPAAPDFSQIERAIAHLQNQIQNMDMQHNPFNINNRKYLLFASFTSLFVLMQTKLLDKYLGKKPIFFNTITAKYMAAYFTAWYLAVKYGSTGRPVIDISLGAILGLLQSFTPHQ
jgi:hypothetical protein